MSMNNSPLVSVFILCFNHEKYIGKTIESVLGQTYGNIELVVVDNCSSDRSAEIISEYAAKDGRIKFFPMEYNTLVSYGSNFAISECRGEYICPLSGDDYFEPEKVAAQLDFMREKGLDLSFTWINVVDESDELIEEHPVTAWFNKPELLDGADILRSYITQENRTNAVTVMFRRTLVEDGTMFDNRLLQTQDYDMWIRLLLRTDRAAVMQRKLSCYRVMSNGANLSMGLTDAKKNRIDFEMLHVFRNFCFFPASLIGVLIGADVSEKDKLERLYCFFELKEIDYGRFAVLLEQFDRLGHDCAVNTEQFAFFFKKYAEFNFAYQSKCSDVDAVRKELVIRGEELRQAKAELDATSASLNAIYSTKFWKLYRKLGRLKKLMTGAL